MMTARSTNNIVLECLRGLAALAVFVFHLSTVKIGPVPIHTAYPGGLGVDVFFVLSGFLIARCVLVPPVFEFRDYLRHRCRRILPAYFACLAILLIVVDTRKLFEADAGLNIGLHLTLQHGWSQRFFQSINSPFWTLSHEWCFYLFMGAVAPMVRGRWLFRVVSLLLGVAVTGRWLTQSGLFVPPGGIWSPFCYLDRFALGILAAKLALTPVSAEIIRRRFIPWLLILGAAAMAWAVWQYYREACQLPAEKLLEGEGAAHFSRRALRSPNFIVLQPLGLSAGCAALLLAVWLRPEPWAGFLRRTPLPWMGKVSYSTYLWHVPVILALLRGLKGHPNSWLTQPWPALALFMGLAYLLSWISYRGFEEPFLRRRFEPPASG